MMRPASLLAASFFAFSIGCGGGSDGSAPPSGVTTDGDAGTSTGNPPGPGDDDAGVSPKPVSTACNATDPRSTPVVLGVLPDESEKPYVDLLSSAQKSIRVLGYQMGYGGILDTLKAKASAGVDVRVILDGQTQIDVNGKYKTMLEAAGAKVEWSDPQFSYMHAKVLVVDDREAIVSTGNYSLSFINKERNYLARLTEAQDVSDLAKLFDADWTRTAPDLSCTRLVVSPVNSRQRLVDLIKSAKKTIYIESMQFSDSAIKQAVMERKAAGVDVEALLASPSWISENATQAPILMQASIPTRWMSNPAVHVKSIIVDGTYAYLGSENVSYTSLSHNREVGIILSDAGDIATMTDTFQKDWASATSF